MRRPRVSLLSLVVALGSAAVLPAGTALPARAAPAASASTSAAGGSGARGGKPVADVRLFVAGPATVRQGKRLVYAIRVVNRGPKAARQVVVGAKLPAHLSASVIARRPGHGRCSSTSQDQKGVCVFKRIKAGGTRLVVISAKVGTSVQEGKVLRVKLYAVPSANRHPRASDDSRVMRTRVVR
ncbi:DUF11 domain-containing protein [Actinomadura hibisca]|uniref:DUF11 domain-containing protein n=1 Tax=Actinomadura hibisca TaxID=68565 RepID=UPI00082B11F7|nr:DUF11 domain-containing protein [Actinomadura hibisca]